MEVGQHPLEDLVEQLGRQAAQALLQRLGRDPKGRDPKHQLLFAYSGQTDQPFRRKVISQSGQSDHSSERSDAEVDYASDGSVGVNSARRFRMESPFRVSL